MTPTTTVISAPPPKNQTGPPQHSEYWKPSGLERVIAVSAYYYVGVMKDGCTVLKYPNVRDQRVMQALRDEETRYIRLEPHEHLVIYKGAHPDGILLEFCVRGELRSLIGSASIQGQKNKIAKQIALCLGHLHQQNFIHCDVHVRNVFITSAMDAKIGDLQGQLYRPDGSIELPTMSQEAVKSRHPEAGDDEFTRRTDIFALGTLYYHVFHGHAPFPDLDEGIHSEEIQQRYRRREYPIHKPQASGMDKIIYKCWTSEYEGADEIVRDLDELDEDL